MDVESYSITVSRHVIFHETIFLLKKPLIRTPTYWLYVDETLLAIKINDPPTLPETTSQLINETVPKTKHKSNKQDQNNTTTQAMHNDEIEDTRPEVDHEEPQVTRPVRT